MPIQINELTVTVEITDSVQQSNPATGSNNVVDTDMRALIRECTEEVMEILKKQKER